jgi:hypothetical protein
MEHGGRESGLPIRTSIHPFGLIPVATLVETHPLAGPDPDA